MAHNWRAFGRALAPGLAQHLGVKNTLRKRLSTSPVLCGFALRFRSYFGPYAVKYLVLILVVYFVYSYLRRARLKEQAEASFRSGLNPSSGTSATAQVQNMITCSACGVHFPQNDAHVGSRGTYCCQAHLLSQEPR